VEAKDAVDFMAVVARILRKAFGGVQNVRSS